MIPTWKYWTLLILIAVAIPLYHSIESPWRLLVCFGVGLAYGAFLEPHRRRKGVDR